MSVAELAMNARTARSRRRAAVIAARRAELELLAASSAADVAERALAQAITTAIWGGTQ